MHTTEEPPRPLSPAEAAGALRALKLIASTDFLTRHELEAIAAARAAFPVDDATWREIELLDVRGLVLEEILPPLDGRTARRLLHAAITVCWADDVYSVQEQAQVARAAAHLGLSPSVRRSFEALVVMERSVVELKAALLGG